MVDGQRSQPIGEGVVWMLSARGRWPMEREGEPGGRGSVVSGGPAAQWVAWFRHGGRSGGPANGGAEGQGRD